MKLSDKKPEITLIACAIIITATVLAVGYFDSPAYNSNIQFQPNSATYITDKIVTTTEAPHFINGKINLNTASLEELMELERIGKVRAQGIIDYREKNGGFVSVNELTNISGITQSVLDKNRDKITVG